MVRCGVCGKDEMMPYRCSYCRKHHCSEHRLPEAHLCPEVQMAAEARLQREVGGDPGIVVHGVGASRPRGLLARTMGRLEGKIAYTLLGVVVVVFLLEQMVYASGGEPAFSRAFVMDGDYLAKPWVLVTSVFAHDPGNLFHLLFNGLALFFFGPLLESRIGSRRFLMLFLVGGALAGLAQITLYTTVLGDARGVVGASGAIMAIIGVLTLLAPRLSVLIWGIFPMPLWAMAAAYAALDLLGLMGSGGGIAHMAHLAGLVFGLALGKHLRDKGFRFPGPAGHIRRPRGW